MNVTVRMPSLAQLAAELPYASFDDIAGAGGIVVVAPHPDDETLGCSGLISAALARGRDAQVVVVSDGGGSHPKSTAFPPERLAALREQETRAAIAELGLDGSAIRFLRLRDGALPATGPEAARAAISIAAVALSHRATSVFVTALSDPHRDHQAVFSIVRMVRHFLPSTRFFAYPIWTYRDPQADLRAFRRGMRLDISPFLDRKRAAIACHRSQVTEFIDDDPDGRRLEPEFVGLFTRPFEIFTEMREGL